MALQTFPLAKDHDILPHVIRLHLRHNFLTLESSQCPIKICGSAGAFTPYAQSFVHLCQSCSSTADYSISKSACEWKATSYHRTALVMPVLMSANESIIYF